MTTYPLDQPAAIRAGEELDLKSLQAWWAAQFPDQNHPLEVQQFPSGFSNLTYLVKSGGAEYVLRRPPFGAKARTAHDMGREFHILSALSPVCSWAPAPVAHCTDETVLGAPFYVMERVTGVILRPHTRTEAAPSAGDMTNAAHALVDTLVELHGVDLERVGLASFGKPDGYVKRQVHGWTERYHRAKTDDIPEMDRTAAWLSEQVPGQSGVTLIHNDYKYDNLVYAPGDFSTVVAVLDWEMATVGDPLMDLGSALGYWTDPDDPPEVRTLQLSPTTLPGNPSRTEIAEAYARAAGRSLDNVVFYYAFGLFKIAVIVQQIYYRYQRGDTQDPRFAGLIDAVRWCARMAQQAVQHQRIDRLFEE